MRKVQTNAALMQEFVHQVGQASQASQLAAQQDHSMQKQAATEQRSVRLGQALRASVDQASFEQQAYMEKQASVNAIDDAATRYAVNAAHLWRAGALQAMRDHEDASAVLTKEASFQSTGLSVAEHLYKIAMEHPEVVLPPELQEAAPEGDVNPEIEQLVDALVEAGVTEEDVADVLNQIAQLQEAGVSPEEIEQAAQLSLAAETGAPVSKEAGSNARLWHIVNFINS